MFCVLKGVNFADDVLFKKSHENDVVIFYNGNTENIHKNGTTLPRCGPKGHAR